MGNITTFFRSSYKEMTPDRALEILYDTLTTQHIRLDADWPRSFAEWCRHLGLPRQKLDRYLRKELGCSGQEWVTAVLDKKSYSSSQSPTCE